MSFQMIYYKYILRRPKNKKKSIKNTNKLATGQFK